MEVGEERRDIEEYQLLSDEINYRTPESALSGHEHAPQGRWQLFSRP